MIQTNLTEIPYTEFQRKQLGLPLYVVYSPMSIDVERYNIPRISRCGECRGYINKHNQWLTAGKVWRCCLCGKENIESSQRYSNFSMETYDQFPEFVNDYYEVYTDNNEIYCVRIK